MHMCTEPYSAAVLLCGQGCIWIHNTYSTHSMGTHVTTTKYGLSECVLNAFWVHSHLHSDLSTWDCILWRYFASVIFTCKSPILCSEGKKAKEHLWVKFFYNISKWIFDCFFKYPALIVFRVLASPTQPTQGDFFLAGFKQTKSQMPLLHL